MGLRWSDSVCDFIGLPETERVPIMLAVITPILRIPINSFFFDFIAGGCLHPTSTPILEIKNCRTAIDFFAVNTYVCQFSGKV